MSGMHTSTADLIRDRVLEIGDGYRAKNAEFIPNGGLPFVRVGNVTAAGIEFDGIDELPAVEEAKYSPKVSKPDDSLVTMKGTVGRVGYVTPHMPPFVYSPQISYWRSRRPDVVHPRWLRYWLESPEFNWQASATKGATDMADYINLRDQRRMQITVPRPAIQARIADILGSLDDLVENNRRRIQLLEEMAQAIYREWFVRFRYPGHENATFVDSPLGSIPGGWEVVPASVLLEINPRMRVDKNIAHPFVTMGDLHERGMFCFSSSAKSGSAGAKFRNGDTLMARITPCLENGKTGLVWNLDPGETARGSTEFIVLRGRMVGPVFTYSLARLPGFRSHAIMSMSGASGRQRVRYECFDSYMVAAPPEALSDEYERRVEPAISTAYCLARQNTVLGGLRDALLPRLVTGRIDVSDLDLDAVLESVA